MSAVADLLAASRAAHRRYRDHAGVVDKDGRITRGVNDDECLAAVTEADAKRRDAHVLDPEHNDPAWSDDFATMRTSHTSLLEFYSRCLAQW